MSTTNDDRSATASKNNNDNVTITLDDKLHALLTSQNHVSECSLVACLLLLRTQSSPQADDDDELWNRHGVSLTNHWTHLLRSIDDDVPTRQKGLTEDNDTTSPVTTTSTRYRQELALVGLAAQWITRASRHVVVTSNKNHENNNNINHSFQASLVRLGHTLLIRLPRLYHTNRLTNASDDSQCQIATLYELVRACRVWWTVLRTDDDDNNNDNNNTSSPSFSIQETLCHLVKAYHNISTGTQDKRFASKNKDTGTSNHNTTNDNTIDPQRQMVQVLEHVLGTNEYTNTVANRSQHQQPQPQEALGQELAYLLETQCSTIVSSRDFLMATFVTNPYDLILQQYWSSSSFSKPKTKLIMPPDMVQLWARVVLHYLVVLATLAPDRLLTKFQTCHEWSDPCRRALQSCLVAPSSLQGRMDSNDKSSSSSLRTLAWLTMTVLTKACGGLEWLVLSNSPPPSDDDSIQTGRHGKLGAATPLCTSLRLAVGEFKIQLALLVATVDATYNQDGSTQGKKSQSTTTTTTAVLLVQVIGQFLQQALHWLVEQASEEQEKTCVIPQDAILHIQESLQEGLMTSIDYVRTMGLFRTTVQAKLAVARLSKATVSVIQLLGHLLSELGEPPQPPGHEKDHDSESNVYLLALHMVLDNTDIDEQELENLIPALVPILTLAGEDSPIPCAMHEPLVSLVVKYWQSTDNLSSVLPACALVELWYSILTSSGGNVPGTIEDLKGRILNSLVGFLQRIMTLAGRSSEFATAVSAVVGCYAAIHGEEPPEPPHAMVLQSAMYEIVER